MRIHLYTILLFLTYLPCLAQVMKTNKDVLAVQANSIDGEIEKMIKLVSADSVKKYVFRLSEFYTRHSLSDTTDTKRGIGAGRRWVATKFKQFAVQNNANLTVSLDPFEVKPDSRTTRIPYTVTMKNVVATLKGNDTTDNRVLLVSGHLDSRNSDMMDSVGYAPGANDDASGVAVVLELARIMSKYKFPCTIMFMAVQGEEQGLLGANYMAQKLKADNVNLIAMLNNDIVGNTLASELNTTEEKTARIFSEMIPADETAEQTSTRNSLKSENDSPSRQLARYVKEASDLYLKGFTATLNARPDRFLRGGDHTPFSRAGYTAIRFTEFNEDFNRQHQNIRTEEGISYGDLPNNVNFQYTANVAKMNLITMASLAKAPGQPQHFTMKINLNNLTYLSWEAPVAGPKPKGYYIVLRETYQPLWEKKIFVNDSKITLPYSKDNYFFGVQSVGEKGHVSQVVVPVPVR